MRTLATKPSSDDLQVRRELIEAGSVPPVIDTTYPLSEAADAIRYVETGRARGKVHIRVGRQQRPRRKGQAEDEGRSLV